MPKLKAVYYINQFYAGLGGEEKADEGIHVFDDKKGPALGIEKYWNGEMEVVKVIACGDNYMNQEENTSIIEEKIKSIVEAVMPDVFIAGPAFNAGRYGVACAKMAHYVKHTLKIPSVTGMYYENPAVPMYVKDLHIISTPETAVGMRKALPLIGKLALKLAKEEPIGPARLEGYLPTGHRYNEYHEKTGAERVVDILRLKLEGEKFQTEVPLRTLEKVPPAKPVNKMSEVVIAMITSGGLVPQGNPDKLKQAFSVGFGKYAIDHLNHLEKGLYESIHGGYDTTIVNEDPHRLIPLDSMRQLEEEGFVHSVYSYFLSTCGVGTNVENSKKIGREMVEELKKGNVSAAILTSTWGTCTRCVATISKELDKAGIPNAVITGFTSIAFNVGANRIIYGGHFTSPAGNPELPIEREKYYRRRILLKAFEAIESDIQQPTIFNVDESKDIQIKESIH